MADALTSDENSLSPVEFPQDSSCGGRYPCSPSKSTGSDGVARRAQLAISCLELFSGNILLLASIRRVRATHIPIVKGRNVACATFFT
jgi:hypothetical protein